MKCLLPCMVGPGEDGAIQEQLDKINLPYNGSNKESSSITIDKYRTNEILKANGFSYCRSYFNF